MPTGRRARWILKLQQYDFKIQHRPGKTNANADALSRMYEEKPSQVLNCFMISIEETKPWKKARRTSSSGSLIPTLELPHLLLDIIYGEYDADEEIEDELNEVISNSGNEKMLDY